MDSCTVLLHANSVPTVDYHRLMRVTDMTRNHLVYQLQFILCLQRVVTKRVTTAEQFKKNVKKNLDMVFSCALIIVDNLTAFSFWLILHSVLFNQVWMNKSQLNISARYRELRLEKTQSTLNQVTWAWSNMLKTSLFISSYRLSTRLCSLLRLVTKPSSSDSICFRESKLMQLLQVLHVEFQCDHDISTGYVRTLQKIHQIKLVVWINFPSQVFSINSVEQHDRHHSSCTHQNHPRNCGKIQ